MAGKQCPNCKELTFFKTPTGRECSYCKTTAITKANNGKGGIGVKCSICNEKTVFKNNGGTTASCRSCGTEYTFPK